jgi:3-oxoadipate enol-lactonase
VAVLRVPGGELHYEAESDGVAVVLVHGLALDARMWDDQVPALKETARVVRYDLRGFGRSTRDADTPYSHADDLWLLLDHLGIDTAVLVGLSMGGRIVLEATLAAPQRVRALVLLDAVLDGVAWDPNSKRGIQAVGKALRRGGLEEAKAAWLSHGFFVPAQRLSRSRWWPDQRAKELWAQGRGSGSSSSISRCSGRRFGVVPRVGRSAQWRCFSVLSPSSTK